MNRHERKRTWYRAGMAVLTLILLASAARSAHAQFLPTQEPQASLERVTLGGVAQWIQIRGADANNPVLLARSSNP